MLFFFLQAIPPARSTLFPYTTLFRSSIRRRRFRMDRTEEDSILMKAFRSKLALLSLTFFLGIAGIAIGQRSEEHTSELQSRRELVCRLLLEKKNLTAASGGPPIVGDV